MYPEAIELDCIPDVSCPEQKVKVDMIRYYPEDPLEMYCLDPRLFDHLSIEALLVGRRFSATYPPSKWFFLWVGWSSQDLALDPMLGRPGSRRPIARHPLPQMPLSLPTYQSSDQHRP